MNATPSSTLGFAAAVLAAACLVPPAVAGERNGEEMKARQAPAVGQFQQEERTRVMGARYFYYCRPGSAIKYRIELPPDADAGEIRIAGVRPAPRLGTCHSY